MKQSKLYTKTRKTLPRDEVAKNAKLLTQAGFIDKEMAGVYSYLPLGLMVMRKIENIIREEMNAIGGEEILMTTLQNPEVWKKSGRWDDKKVNIWFKTRGDEFGLGNTHEEPLVESMKHHIESYKDLPVYAYQFQTKFRNEPRAKSGLLRGKEFIMKDLYSFSKNEEEHEKFYEKCKEAYHKIFDRVGIGKITYLTFADGEPFSEFSHEFQTLNEVGEDTIYLDEKKKIAINKEIYTDKIVSEMGLKKTDLIEKKAIEVGNIFPLGSKFSDAGGLKYLDKNGKKQSVIMGSYGIGLGRLMATVVEVFSDKDGIVWPESIAPFKVHLVELGNGLGNKIYSELQKEGIDVLYDDRDATPGEKLKDADLIGIPWRMVVSEKTKDKVELKKRDGKSVKILSYEESIRKLS